jgi:hypothetical protein
MIAELIAAAIVIVLPAVVVLSMLGAIVVAIAGIAVEPEDRRLIRPVADPRGA